MIFLLIYDHFRKKKTGRNTCFFIKALYMLIIYNVYTSKLAVEITSTQFRYDTQTVSINLYHQDPDDRNHLLSYESHLEISSPNSTSSKHNCLFVIIYTEDYPPIIIQNFCLFHTEHPELSITNLPNLQNTPPYMYHFGYNPTLNCSQILQHKCIQKKTLDKIYKLIKQSYFDHSDNLK